MKVKLITLILLCYLNLIGPVYAYMDPGSFTILLQALISGIVGFFVYVKIFSKNIKNFVNKFFSKFKKKKD